MDVTCKWDMDLFNKAYLYTISLNETSMKKISRIEVEISIKKSIFIYNDPLSNIAGEFVPFFMFIKLLTFEHSNATIVSTR